MILKPRPFRKPNLGSPLGKGLIGCWLFNDGPQALGTTYDLSGNGNHGTLVADTHSVPGKFGNALDFDGTGDYVNCGDVTTFDGLTEMSFVVWYNQAAQGSGSRTILISKDETFEVRIRADNLNVYALMINNEQVRFVTSVSNGVWTQVVMTWIGGGADSRSIYENGVWKETKAGTKSSIDNTAFSMTFGGRTTSYPYNGQIDHAIIYNRALSAGEVASLYAEPFQMFHREPIELWAGATSGGAPPAGVAPTGNLYGPLWGPLAGVA